MFFWEIIIYENSRLIYGNSRSPKAKNLTIFLWITIILVYLFVSKSNCFIAQKLCCVVSKKTLRGG